MASGVVQGWQVEHLDQVDNPDDIASLLAEKVDGCSAGGSCPRVVSRSAQSSGPGPAEEAQLAVLEVRALANSALFEDAPARARVLFSSRLAWAKSSGGGAHLTSRQPSSTQALHIACETQPSPSCRMMSSSQRCLAQYTVFPSKRTSRARASLAATAAS